MSIDYEAEKARLAAKKKREEAKKNKKRIHANVETRVKKKENPNRIHANVKTKRKVTLDDFTNDIDHKAEKARLAAKKKEKKIESLGEIEVTAGKDTWSPTKILRSKKVQVGGHRTPIYEKVKNGRAVGRMKRVGGTDRAPKYEKVKNYDDYTSKEKSAMSDAEYDKMEKSSTIQYRNPDYKRAKKINPHSRFSEGGQIVADQYTIMGEV